MLRRPILAPLLAAAVALGMAGCTGSEEPTSTPTVQPTPIDAFVSEGLTLSRTDFCDEVPDPAVEAAIGEVATTAHYGSGEPARITGSVRDVSHEFNCTWRSEAGDQARAWVFAPQVTREQARTLVRQARRRPGCRQVDGHGFGSPGTGTVCRIAGRVEAAYRGLFVDTWLTCAVTDGGAGQMTEQELLGHTGAWCVAAAQAAAR